MLMFSTVPTHDSWDTLTEDKRMLGKLKGNKLFIDDLWHNCNKQECHNIVFMDNLWYNCDKQEYHNFALWKRLILGNLWHRYDQYECQSIPRREKFSDYN